MKKSLITILSTILLVSMSTTNIFAEDADAKNITTGVSYATLQDAINAVNNGEEIIVIDDIVCGTSITINNGKKFTINFNDGSTQRSFKWDVTSEFTIDQDIFTIGGNSDVTIKNMKFLVDSSDEEGNRIFKVNSTGTLTLSQMESNDENGKRNIPVLNNGGIVTIDGGNITTDATNRGDLISPNALNPVVQNLGGKTTFTGNGTYTINSSMSTASAVWLGDVITMNDPSADSDNDCGTVVIESGTFNKGPIVTANGKGNVTINNATHSDNYAILVYHGGFKSNITVNDITSSTTVFAYLYDELVTNIDFQNGNVKYMPTRFCINYLGNPMDSVSIKNGKFGPKSGSNDIHDEINNLLATGATLTALTGDPNNYTYKVETHNHLFTFTASNNKISATCITGCDKGYDTTPLTLTLTAPSSLVYDGNVKEFTFADGETNAWTEATLAPPAITYEAKPGSSLTNDKAVNVGSYTASITVDTDKTASFDFEITNATPTPTPDPDPTPRYKIPNTGVESMPTNNHSLLKLSSLSLLAVGTYLVIKKKKDN